MALIEACVRLIPGVLGDEASPAEESFAAGFWNIRNTPGPRASKAGPSRTC